ncbi:MAG TPA: SURF1 family cytochrome oxidase biogenesis protein, partial [Euzebya sp.]|nr:SURF1 family cytochrome oxidase biogenesis protein [Euzebya sp.]
MRLLLRPGWILTHLAVVAIAVTFVNLGMWQLQRHAETRGENARITQAQQSTALPLGQALSQPELFLQPTTVTGTYDRGADVRLSPRSRNQLPGLEVLTPL